MRWMRESLQHENPTGHTTRRTRGHDKGMIPKQRLFRGRRHKNASFRVDGELESRATPTATAFSRPRGDDLDMRRRLPGRFGSVWRHRCGRCQPRSLRFLSPIRQGGRE